MKKIQIISCAVELASGTALGERSHLHVQKLPVILVEPMKMNVDVGAEVVNKHKPTYVQTHSKKHVKADW